MNDCEYMRTALQFAKKGAGWTSPNPMVGAVIVKNGKIIGSGFHERYGEPHAERNALRSCTETPAGATLYVTLEPCCHHGKQPPCVDAVLESGITRVVIGSADPNPLVGGKGVRRLKESGIEVSENILKEECDRLNEVFFHYIQTKRPFVVMKYAMTMDGKIAAVTGNSKWITEEKAREHVHLQRHRYTAIMVGVGTVLADDPLLTCRIKDGKNPIRIICDTNLRTPLSAQIIRTAKKVPTIIATCCTEKEKQLAYLHAGCRILTVPEKNGRVDLQNLMPMLGEEKIDSLLLEGGGTLNWAALESGIVQKVHAYIAPKLLGGQSAKTPVEGIGFHSPDSSVRLINSSITQLGEDFLIESEVDKHVYRNC
ncbi:bifunctional diaminohydroxyphosphoribosylaminopyrimidine deaminase/5-amino-6-(5-phosphoribosylamino)uracil reductase RibD [Treponema phagedenis]|uniref:Riboflavin biosynthesis protein RibD n=2 Tax=Treponema phagedenis TaxID=162 RepID=A0A0B7H2P6_TREPH|nr:bifunctional diaminohydroxyphosphoribosylaminopyrimidine deaminase/5-amino-6-(5-phosphoribosylamino)uracil reductase RibD [Treponema phagedenis]CEM63246.1 fused diaminohydroxyphosphoribosylaminopyrimidine deaminase;5-amino-6-(5-phosphoribosylamino) uracil reductase [Treponema phagedenis]